MDSASVYYCPNSTPWFRFPISLKGFGYPLVMKLSWAVNMLTKSMQTSRAHGGWISSYNFTHCFSSPKTQPRKKHPRYFLLSTKPLQNRLKLPPSSHSKNASDPAFDSLWWKRVIHDESFLSLLAFGFSADFEINKTKLGDLKAYLII